MAIKLSALAAGTLVKDVNTKYNGKPIIWNIVEVNHSGYPSNSVTLRADKILALKCFDAQETGNAYGDRKSYGNNRYIYANIRAWANSSSASWYSPAHAADAAPSSGNTQNGNAYSDEAGFLYNFSAAFRNALMPTSITAARATIDGGGTEGCTDKIFLPSCTELALSGGAVCGVKFAVFNSNTARKFYPTQECVSSSDYAASSLAATKPWMIWTRDAKASAYHLVYHTYTSGAIDNGGAAGGRIGFLPFCNISASTMVSDTTDSDGCYTIIFNAAPSAPSSMSLPSTVKSGVYFTVSWSSSTDRDGNLSGYIVQRSLGGGSWSQIYQGGSTSTSDYISYGAASSVQYRVYAYDTQGASSGYTYSSTKTIVHNLAPSSPGSITVPVTVNGGSALTVSWGAASDSDGNLSGYQLYRQYNGGSWTQLYSGASRSYTDSITKGWTSVAYRVRAYDSYNAYSSYTTSATRTVNNNTVPSITCGASDLGDVTEPFSFDYTVTDADGDELSVTEALDSKTRRTFTAASDETSAFSLDADDFMRVLNGPHTVTVTATDSSAASAALSVTFNKAVHALSITLANPLPADALITKCVLSIAREIPADAAFTVEVTNNALDNEPAWEDATDSVILGLNYLFENAAAANGSAFNLRIRAERGPSGVGGYIGTIGGGFE